MSSLAEVASELARAHVQLSRSLAEAGAWNDEQRTRLERARIDPLLSAASTYSSGLQQAIESLRAAERLLA